MGYLRRFKSKHNAAIYHCISRTVNGEKLFDNEAKEMLQKHLHQVADFSGVKIITYALMTNHFHILVKVEEQKNISDKELLRRYKVLYPNPTKYASAQIEILEDMLKNNYPEAQQFRERLLARMGDVSEFMKTLKQRFSICFNRNHNRFGPLWAERFTSTIIEGAKSHHFALQMVAAYIDLNPVRAGIVRDPKDYRWCGYGEAEAGNATMRKGLRMATEEENSTPDTDILASYRLALFGKGVAPKRGDPASARISKGGFAKVQKARGRLSVQERLRLRNRSFTRGGVVGGPEFVDEHLEAYRDLNNVRHHIGPRSISADPNTLWPSGLFAMRSGSEKVSTNRPAL